MTVWAICVSKVFSWSYSLHIFFNFYVCNVQSAVSTKLERSHTLWLQSSSQPHPDLDLLTPHCLHLSHAQIMGVFSS